MPLTDGDQRCHSFSLRTTPKTLVDSYDEPGGAVHHFNLRAAHTQLLIEAEACVETFRSNPFVDVNLIRDDWSLYSAGIHSRFVEYLAPTRLAPHIPEVHQIAQVARKHAERPSAASFVISLNHKLHRLLEYEKGITHVHTSLEQFLEQRRGVCQDFAHTMLAVCRSQGIPSRYVSGYLYGPPGGPSTRAEGATHAWVECLLFDQDGEPNWHGFDPTNDVATDDKYTKAHVGRDYHDVVPIKGVYRGLSEHHLEVEVTVKDASVN